MNQQKIVIATAVVIVVLFAVGGFFYNAQQAKELQKIAKERAELFERPHSWSKGDKDAKVHIVKFFDPSCVTCAQFHPLVKGIMKKNEGKIRLTLRYVPHSPSSEHVVRMIEAAREQGKLTETLELAFVKQQYWSNPQNPNPQYLWKFLPELGLDIDKLIESMRSPAMDSLVEQDLADAKVLGITKVPTYFVNTKPLPKFGYEQLKELIDSELQK